MRHHTKGVSRNLLIMNAMNILKQGIAIVVMLVSWNVSHGIVTEPADTLDWNAGLNRETTDPEKWERNERLSGRNENPSSGKRDAKAPVNRKKPQPSKVLPDKKSVKENYTPTVKAINTATPESRGTDWVHPDDYRRYIAAATDGDAEAQRIIGRCYMTGIGVNQDYKEAWKWMARAAGSDDLEAEYQLGMMYRDGIGVKKSATEAAYWFRKSARNGHALSLLNLGHAFENGEGVLPDNRIAAENYWRAAERGNAEGAYRYATMLRTGQGVNVDLPRSLKYYMQAAEAGFGDSEQQVAALKQQGVSLPSVSKAAPKKVAPARNQTTKKKSPTRHAKKKRRG